MKYALIAILAIIVVSFAWSYMSEDRDSVAMPDTGESVQSLDNKSDSSNGDIVTDKAAPVESTAEMKKSGSYEVYSKEALMSSVERSDVVLFFHASWCPSCRALNLNIEKNLASIPSNLSILKVDYDKEVDLKKKYGITYQHTLVRVDRDGNMIKKWSGSPNLEHILSQLK